MKTKNKAITILAILSLTLILTGCGVNQTYNVIKTNETKSLNGVWSQYDAEICKTKDDVRITCAGCNDQYYSVCTTTKNTQGITTCFC